MLKLARLILILIALGGILPPQVNADNLEGHLQYTGHQYLDPFAKKSSDSVSAPIEVKAVNQNGELTEEEVYRRYKVQGVVWNTDRRQAIVNRRIVEIGDAVDGAVIRSITENGIELELADKRYLLKRDKK